MKLEWNQNHPLNSNHSCRECSGDCTSSQKCRWTFSPLCWTWLMRDELCNSASSSARPPGRSPTQWWSSSWPGALWAHGGRHWRQSASCWGSYLPGLILSACKWIYFLYENFHLVNNLTPSRGWSLWRNRFPALPLYSHASPSSVEPFSLWILAPGQTDCRIALNWTSSTVFLKVQEAFLFKHFW